MAEAYIVAAARTAGGRAAAASRAGIRSTWPRRSSTRWSSARGRPGAGGRRDHGLRAARPASRPTNVGAQRRAGLEAAARPCRAPIDRQCGSSQQALHFAAQAVMSGTMDCVIAAGVESMTRVPMFTPLPGRTRKRAWALHEPGDRSGATPASEFSQFMGAEMMAEKYGCRKDALDRYALQSHQRAMRGHAGRRVRGRDRAGGGAHGRRPDAASMHIADEGIRFDATLEGIAGVKLLREGGRITAATASQICDGASGVMVVNERGLKALGVKPLARIHHMTVIGDDPVIMLEAPLPATQRALKKAGMTIDDIDLFEVNEAFAPVPLAWLQATGADPARLNVQRRRDRAGPSAGRLGHQADDDAGARAARSGKRYGLQTMCEGGGMANVTIVERL